MTVTVENKPTVSTRTRTQTPTAYLKSNLGGKKIAEIFSVPLSTLKVYPGFNLRVDYALDDLKDFINSNGIAFPPLRLMYIDGELYIDEGHRRHAACIELDLDPSTPIPVYVGEASSPEERLARQVTSNSGKNYTFIETVYVVKELIQKYHLDQNGVAKLIGKSQGAISQMTKFFGYSQLLFVAIKNNDIKYTRVLELQRKGLNEGDILAMIAKEKHASEDIDDTVVEATDDSPATIVNIVDDSHPPVLNHTDIKKLDELLDDSEEPEPAILAKPAKQTIKTAGAALVTDKGSLTTKKVNPAKLLTDFLASAEILDNKDGTYSYIVSKKEHIALQRGANNI